MLRRFAAALLPILLIAGPAAPVACGHAALVRRSRPRSEHRGGADLGPADLLRAAGTVALRDRVIRCGRRLLRRRPCRHRRRRPALAERPACRGSAAASTRSPTASSQRSTGTPRPVATRSASANRRRARPRSLTTTPSTSWLELVARWIFLVGLVALLGGAVAAVARFGGRGATDLKLAAGGWLFSVAGLVLLAVAQREAGGILLRGPARDRCRRALIWRALAIAAGARRCWSPGAGRRSAARRCSWPPSRLVAITVHVAAGHAAAGSWSSGLTVSAQVAHFAAAGIWFGGLAALLLGVAGRAPPKGRRRRAPLLRPRRGGPGRARRHRDAAGDRRALLGRRAPPAATAGRCWRRSSCSGSSSRSPPATGAAASDGRTDLAPLRRRSRAELAAGGRRARPRRPARDAGAAAAGQASGGRPTGLSDTGSDFATTVRGPSDRGLGEAGTQPVRPQLEDYDSGEPVAGQPRQPPLHARLTIPRADPTTLALRPAVGRHLRGAGANLAYDGRWGVSALIHRGDGARSRCRSNSTSRGRSSSSRSRRPAATAQVHAAGRRRSATCGSFPTPNGRARARSTSPWYTLFQSVSQVEQMVVTAAAAGGPDRQQPMRRLGAGRFVADVDLAPGPFTITVVARDQRRHQAARRVSIWRSRDEGTGSTPGAGVCWSCKSSPGEAGG